MQLRFCRWLVLSFRKRPLLCHFPCQTFCIALIVLWYRLCCKSLAWLGSTSRTTHMLQYARRRCVSLGPSTHTHWYTVSCAQHPQTRAEIVWFASRSLSPPVVCGFPSYLLTSSSNIVFVSLHTFSSFSWFVVILVDFPLKATPLV